MSLGGFLTALRRRWWVILLCAVLGMGAGVAAAKATKTTFTAHTSVLVALPGAGSVAELQQGDIFTMSRARSYAILASSRRVLDKVASELGAGKSDLTSQVFASVQPETSVIDINAVDGDPAYAARLANETVKQLALAVDQVDRGKNKNGASVSIVQLSPATQPTAPTSPNAKMNAMFGLVSGLTLGLVLALLTSRKRRPAAVEPADAQVGATRVSEEPKA